MEAISSAGVVGGSKRVSPHRGQMSLVPGVRLNAALFDGSSSGLVTDKRDSCFTNPELCTDGMTLSFWLKFISIPSNTDHYVLSNGGQTRHSYGYAVLVKTMKILIFVKTRVHEWAFTSSDTVQLHVWDFLTITWHMDSGLQVFKNGSQLAGSVTETNREITSTAYNDYRIGLPNNSENSARFGHFIIDEFMFCASRVPPDDANDIFESEIGKKTCVLLQIQLSKMGYDLTIVQ